MPLITSWREIEDNIRTLERYKDSKNYEEVEFYNSLIKRGICFVVYRTRKSYGFAPSRFIGYQNNNMGDHKANDWKDGRETTPAISDELGYDPEYNATLEEEYKRYCRSLGFEPNRRGPCNLPRKYWNTDLQIK
jgi:hypothetical protein